MLKEEGNYVQAHNHINGLNDSINETKGYMDEIPDLIRETQKSYQDNSRFKIWL